jgi:hypothetical protein
MVPQPDNGRAWKLPDAEPLLKQLGGLKYDPNAARSFEFMSGGFIWSDERPQDYDDVAAGYAFRILIGFRASLIFGKPREDLRFVWDAVSAGCPNWPGFRPERFSIKLARELASANHRSAHWIACVIARPNTAEKE